MYYGQFAKSLKESGVVESIRSYGHLIEMLDDGSIVIDRNQTDFKSLGEARKYIKTKQFSEKLQVQISQEIYEEISDIRIANIIREHHEIKVTDTLIESYIDLASSKIFTVDPVVHKIRSLNKLDVVVENKLHYELSDGSVVAIDNTTQEILNNLLGNHNDIVTHMRESKENFMQVIEQIKG
jgi:TRAP-type mannitol/chloroaromatic compound transport system substrate-binding protein